VTDFDPDWESQDNTTPKMIWGLEIEWDRREQSIFRSARRVILDDSSAEIQTLDGAYETFPIERIRKILAMKSEAPQGYTDEDLGADEIY
jgi:hypothetical protein